ncbi:hypothetical protein NW754_012732 [Fusarium falciforme]|uniref:Uncharacterized protein n=1 Tax=Fusarium falciforme TaxID=195108 RepID=A0A9W8RGH1_9HYPO|nr:hypothetical protein NW754_012732 [Fusarium falciforme]KAJ4196716.1 hypothetical protein NW755_001490 [Fusarium falciforme]KAJ4207790.1 hypothetical protein NW767_002029 [Fusarium falciforme]KAJ4259119.1 hypothetical protein NW757_002452 [Fusarium falciforme]
MDERSQRAEAQAYTASLDQTLKELQQKVREHETDLERLRSGHGVLPQSVAGQARVIQTALKEVTDSDPFLPAPGSLLPALLALRKTHQTIQESNAYLASQRASHEQLSRQLEADQARLKDQNLLGEALSARIQSLRDELDANTNVTPAEGARERLQELRSKKKSYDRETSKLMKVLLKFIDNQLAPMLAAEELGGPVVGDLMDIDNEDLAAGFNAQGKLKKAKEGTGQDDKRQRRIDEIWGQAGDETGGRQDEVTGAAAEMRQLAEELLNTLAEANGDNSASYVRLPRESAAARFLVRSKVAQFHPRDATRLRLVDFGRDLEA